MKTPTTSTIPKIEEDLATHGWQNGKKPNKWDFLPKRERHSSSGTFISWKLSPRNRAARARHFQMEMEEKRKNPELSIREKILDIKEYLNSEEYHEEVREMEAREFLNALMGKMEKESLVLMTRKEWEEGY